MGQDAPGVLIVTRLKAEADALVESINGLAGDKKVAVTTHSDHKIAAGLLRTYPVLVVTHEAFRLSLDAINRGDNERSNWNAFMAHPTPNSRRKLVVVDEALDIVEEGQVTATDIRTLEAVIPPLVRSQHPDEIASMELVREVMETIELQHEITKLDDPTAKSSERILSDVGMLPDVDFTGLRKALRGVRLDHRILGREDRKEADRLSRRYDTILKGVAATLENWYWYAKAMRDHTLNTARLIVPDDAETGAVVLDATASRNLIYNLFKHRADVIRPPAVARRYDNVKLAVSRGHKVGKVSLTRSAKVEAPKFVAALEERFGPERRVLVLCHKFVAPHFQACTPHFNKFEVGTWGAVAGRNDWRDCDVVAVFGLPIMPDTWSANVYMALQGLQSTEWLNASDRPFETHKDIRRALKISRTVVDMVQGLNRAQCRNVIDTEGHCAPTDIVLLLPNGRDADEYLDGIHHEMPGVHETAFEYGTTKRRAKRSNFAAALVAYGAAMPEGRKSATDIRRELSVSSTQWERLVANLKDTGSDLSKSLRFEHVTYVVEGTGRGSRSYLSKFVD
jgi:hypothetical protein